MPIPPTRSRRTLEKIGCGEKIPFVSFRRSINQEDCSLAVAPKMKRFFPLIELIVLLSAPMEVIMKRLEARSLDGYANTYQERQKVSGLISTIEPLLRDCADHEIDTTRPVDATVDEIHSRLSRQRILDRRLDKVPHQPKRHDRYQADKHDPAHAETSLVLRLAWSSCQLWLCQLRWAIARSDRESQQCFT
jgi:hypothetical protein